MASACDRLSTLVVSPSYLPADIELYRVPTSTGGRSAVAERIEWREVLEGDLLIVLRLDTERAELHHLDLWCVLSADVERREYEVVIKRLVGYSTFGDVHDRLRELLGVD